MAQFPYQYSFFFYPGHYLSHLPRLEPWQMDRSSCYTWRRASTRAETGTRTVGEAVARTTAATGVPGVVVGQQPGRNRCHGTWPRPFAWRLVGGAKGEGGPTRRVWWLWAGCCWLCRNTGRVNQITERVWYVILSHDFHIKRVTGFIVDMARSVKVDKLSTRVHVVLLSTSRAVASAAWQVGYKQLKHKQSSERICQQ